MTILRSALVALALSLCAAIGLSTPANAGTVTVFKINTDISRQFDYLDGGRFPDYRAFRRDDIQTPASAVWTWGHTTIEWGHRYAQLRNGAGRCLVANGLNSPIVTRPCGNTDPNEWWAAVSYTEQTCPFATESCIVRFTLLQPLADDPYALEIDGNNMAVLRLADANVNTQRNAPIPQPPAS